MYRNKTIAWLACLAASLLVLVACTPAATGTPTPDANAVYTQAAGTVQAALTQSGALTPSATATTAPTNTPEATAAPTLAETAASPAAPMTPIPVSTATKAGLPDKAQYVGQGIADDTKFDPGAPFTITWTVKNTGTTTWTTKYLLRFYSGDQMGAPATVAFPKEVKPGENVDLSVNMSAPASSGTFISNWVLTNADGSNFYPLYIQIKVGNAPTATVTSAAPTDTPVPATSVPSATPEPSVTP
jgi:hypothetical protein